jgi:hypothetical protein
VTHDFNGSHCGAAGCDTHELHRKASDFDVDLYCFWLATWEAKLKPGSLSVACLVERKTF